MANIRSPRMANPKKWTLQKEGEFTPPGAVNEAADRSQPRIVKDRETGRIAGVILPDGQSFKADEVTARKKIEEWKNSPEQRAAKILEEQKLTSATNKIIGENTPLTEFQQAGRQEAGQVGQLSPEQQAAIQTATDTKIRRWPGFRQVGSIAGERAAGAAVAGAVGGSAIPVVGTLAGAAGAGAIAATTGVFSAYKSQDVENIDKVNSAVASSKSNINLAIKNANAAKTPEELDAANDMFSKEIANLLVAAEQYKKLENRREWVTKVADRQLELELYLSDTLPSKKITMTSIFNGTPLTADFDQQIITEEADLLGGN